MESETPFGGFLEAETRFAWIAAKFAWIAVAFARRAAAFAWAWIAWIVAAADVATLPLQLEDLKIAALLLMDILSERDASQRAAIAAEAEWFSLALP